MVSGGRPPARSDVAGAVVLRAPPRASDAVGAAGSLPGPR